MIAGAQLAPAIISLFLYFYTKGISIMVATILAMLYLIEAGLITGFLMLLANTWMYDSTWRKVYADTPECLKIIADVRKESCIACCWIAAAAASVIILILMVNLYADVIPDMLGRLFS